MKAVKVQYTVQPAYIEQNKANIRKVMEVLKLRPIEGMLYSAFTTDEVGTFVHINIARDGETMSKLNNVKEFKEFRMALKASQPIHGPKATNLEPVGAGFSL